jgi:hypothetical protein
VSIRTSTAELGKYDVETVTINYVSFIIVYVTITYHQFLGRTGKLRFKVTVNFGNNYTFFTATHDPTHSQLKVLPTPFREHTNLQFLNFDPSKYPDFIVYFIKTCVFNAQRNFTPIDNDCRLELFTQKQTTRFCVQKYFSFAKPICSYRKKPQKF